MVVWVGGRESDGVMGMVGELPGWLLRSGERREKGVVGGAVNMVVGGRGGGGSLKEFI
jgi:hypothetical protein